LTLLFSVLVFASTFAIAQQVRIRSRIAPPCTTVTGNPNWKYSDIFADGNIAVMGSFNCRGAFIIDISNPDAPTLASWYNPGNNQQFLEAIVIGNRGYFGSGNGGGVHIVDLSDPTSPSLLSIVGSSANGHNSIHEMMVFDQGAKRFLIENFNSTSNKIIKIFDVTNPAAPFFIRDLNPTEPVWIHAMHVRGNRMFTSGFGNSANRGRTEIYDISNLDTTAPTLLGFIEDTTATTAGNSMHSSWTSEDGNYLYSAREITNSNGPNPGDIRVYDITNPAVPLLIRKISMNDLRLNAITPHNPVVLGNKLFVSWYQAGAQVFDIGTDPSEPKRVGQYDTFANTFAPPSAESLTLADEPWDIICGSAGFQNALPTSYDGNWAVFPQLGEDKVLLGDLSSGLIILDVTGLNSAPKNLVSDFDGDKSTDLSIYRPATGEWYFLTSEIGDYYSVGWGLPGDIAVPADYDGDGITDPAVWRPSNGSWYLLKSGGGIEITQWGLPGDVPVQGDFDADGRVDFAVWRPSDGTWYLLQSTLGIRTQQWGLNGDKIAVGDYEGDGKSDLAVWRPSNGTWYVFLSSSSQLVIQQWGLTGDMPLVTDFDGNGRSEFTVFRPSDSTWYQLDIYAGTINIQTFGLSGDTPVPADFDGDRKTDLAVFRPSENAWYRLYSGDFSYRIDTFGLNGDIPSPSAVQPK
ncbi:MAG: FG-GAP-like repeat-containing protein, partial [Pyrinomonadaceae bacterium]